MEPAHPIALDQAARTASGALAPRSPCQKMRRQRQQDAPPPSAKGRVPPRPSCLLANRVASGNLVLLTRCYPDKSTTFRLAVMQYIVLRYDSLVIRARWRRKRKGVIDYPTLAELRYRIRKFLRVREVAARAAGVEPQQYLVLLQLNGLESRLGRRRSGVLAERLQIRPRSVVELVDRLAGRGMVARRRDTRDRRSRRRAAGRRHAVLRRLASAVPRRPRTQGPALVSVLRRLIPRSTPRRQVRAPRGTRKDGSALTAGAQLTGPPAFRRAQGVTTSRISDPRSTSCRRLMACCSRQHALSFFTARTLAFFTVAPFRLALRTAFLTLALTTAFFTYVAPCGPPDRPPHLRLNPS